MFKMLCVGALSAVVVVLLAGASAAAVPGPRNDYVKTPENKKVTFGVLANDSPGAGDKIDPTSLNINTFPSGDLSLDLNAKFTYTPPPGFTGPDSFTYQVCAVSNLNQCAIATVFITVGTGTTTTTTVPEVAPPPPAPPPPAAPAAQASDANALPRTGTSTGALVLLGLALCAVGAVSIRATKRWGGTTD